MGMRALQLMTDPEAIKATDNWMSMFGESNQGAEFNMHKQQLMNQEAEVQVMDEIAAKEARG